MRNKLLIIAAVVVGLCLVCGIVLLTTNWNLTVNIRPMCPPPGYEDTDGTKHPFSWTQIESAEYPVKTPEGTILIKESPNGPDVTTQSDGIQLVNIIPQSNDVWRYFRFDIAGETGIYGPVHVLWCVQESTFWLDISGATFRFWGQGDS